MVQKPDTILAVVVMKLLLKRKFFLPPATPMNMKMKKYVNVLNVEKKTIIMIQVHPLIAKAQNASVVVVSSLFTSGLEL
jgi:hypothetical protein